MVSAKHLGDFACLGPSNSVEVRNTPPPPNTILQTDLQARYWISLPIYKSCFIQALWRLIIILLLISDGFEIQNPVAKHLMDLKFEIMLRKILNISFTFSCVSRCFPAHSCKDIVTRGLEDDAFVTIDLSTEVYKLDPFVVFCQINGTQISTIIRKEVI